MPTYTLEKDFPIDTIDSESGKYCLEYYDQKHTHRKGVAFKEFQEYGLLYPPIIIREGLRYSLVMGKPIIDTYRKLSMPIPYVLVITRERNEYEFFKYLVYMKKEMQGFNIIEKSMAVKKIFTLTNRFDDEVLSLLEIPKNQRYRENLLKLSTASENIKGLLVQSVLHENTVFAIFTFPESTWDMLANFVMKISLGTKKRNKILNMIHDIALEDTVVLKKLIESEDIEHILNSSIDPPHKGEKVLLYIEKLRYPNIYKYKEKFYNKLKEVGIDRRFRIMIPENFENWDFKLVIPFSSVNDLKKDIEELNTIAENKAFTELMRLRSY